jgi:methoxymalonate biosynthesis acyl carrier protein
MELNAKIRAYIQKNMIVYDDEAEFTDEDDIFRLGFVNSLFAMKLINYIEREYGVVIQSEDIRLDNFSSVTNIVHFIAGKLSVVGQNQL